MYVLGSVQVLHQHFFGREGGLSQNADTSHAWLAGRGQVTCLAMESEEVEKFRLRDKSK